MSNLRFSLTNLALSTAILSEGVVYGTDVFFAVVGQKALGQSSPTSLTEVVGRLHETADRRMPVFGVMGLVSSLVAGLVGQTKRRRLSLIAFLAQLVYLGLYNSRSKPINLKFRAAAQVGEPLSDAHSLQQQWDRIVIVRAGLLTAVLTALLAAIASTKAE